MTMREDLERASYARFVNSPVAKAHTAIRDEVISELHLDFERRPNGMHAVCCMCRGSIVQLTQQERDGHETGYTYTLDAMGSLFMAHFMQRHYEQEGRTS